MKNNMDSLRKQIDFIDKQIIILLAKRFMVVKKIGRLKKNTSLPALDKKRWDEVKKNRIAIAKRLGLKKGLIDKILESIHEEALEIEKSL